MSIDFNSLTPEDRFVYDEMFNWNVYQVEQQEIENKVILDIGGHLGMFDILCSKFNPAQIISVEANPNNCLQLTRNTIEFNNIKVINAACSYRTGDLITISDEGCMSQVGKGTITVPTVSLEFLVNLTGQSDQVLKIDVEGAEHDIFTKSPKHIFSKIKTIYMEAHGENVSGKGKTIESIDNYVQSLGYTKTWHGLFHTNMPDGTKKPNEDIAILKFTKAL